MFGSGIFGDIVFADLDGLGRRPGRRGRGIGGSGFPPNWQAIIADNAAEADREKRRIDEEIAAMRAAGVL